MAVAKDNKALATDINNAIDKLNSTSSLYGTASTGLSHLASVDQKLLATTYNSMATRINACINKSTYRRKKYYTGGTKTGVSSANTITFTDLSATISQVYNDFCCDINCTCNTNCLCNANCPSNRDNYSCSCHSHWFQTCPSNKDIGCCEGNCNCNANWVCNCESDCACDQDCCNNNAWCGCEGYCDCDGTWSCDGYCSDYSYDCANVCGGGTDRVCTCDYNANNGDSEICFCDDDYCVCDGDCGDSYCSCDNECSCNGNCNCDGNCNCNGDCGNCAQHWSGCCEGNCSCNTHCACNSDCCNSNKWCSCDTHCSCNSECCNANNYNCSCDSHCTCNANCAGHKDCCDAHRTAS